MRIQKHSCLIILSLLLTSLIQSACSNPVTDASGFVNCQNGANPTSIKQDFKFPGVLLFAKKDTSEIVAFNGETHELASIYTPPSDAFYNTSLSPDSKKLIIFYQEPSDRKTLFIVILSNLGTIETKNIALPISEQIESKANTWLSGGWVNNNYIEGILYDRDNHEDNLWESWLLNLEQLEWKSLSSVYSNLHPAENSGFSISPDLTKVLYVNREYQLVLYDLVQNKTLWTYSDYDGIHPFVNSPRLADATWSEDGKLLATTISNNANQNQPSILILDQSGKTLHLMDFGTGQLGLSWSNNKNFLSFWGNQSTGLSISSGSSSVIRVMDIENGLARDLCMLGENIVPWGSIIWSPDQQFLAYTVQDGNAKREELIIQKLNDPQLQIIPLYDESQNYQFLGWSKEHWNKTEP
jgi:dipeptidyl aminopeptidase/acylaminoacyl peptidase